MKTMGKRSLSSVLATLLNVSWFVVAAVLVIAALVTVVAAFGHMRGATLDLPVSFTADGAALGIRSPSLGIDAAGIQDARGSLVFSPPTGMSLVVPLVVVMAMLTVALLAIGQLRALFRTLRAGQPFVPANAVRIRWIGWIVIGGELARAAATFAANRFAAVRFSADGLVFDARLDIHGMAIIAGLIILVIAEVFRVGTALDDEQSLTV